MLNSIAENTILWGSEVFGYGKGPVGNPAVFIFGFPVYLYALIIVFGMCLAILVAGYLFKKRGYDPYDITIYAIAVIPIGVLGARAYIYIFPWADHIPDWSTYFDFRSGGLGIYGGVIAGYIAAYVTCKIKKQDFRIVGDCIIPGLFLAQSIGRWGNFFNQEAYGNAVTNPSLQFFPYAVYIDGSGWHQATFFYESLCTFIGFLVCMLVLNRSKHYKLGWCRAFYGIYYGIVRLFIEGLRTDSLYLYVGTMKTDIKISQLVSIFTIVMGVWTLSVIYRKNIHALYRKFFKTELQELSVSRWLLLALIAVLVGVAATLFALGGEFRFIFGVCASALAVYCLLGIFSINDRMKLYCPKCGTRNEPENGVASPAEMHRVAEVAFLCLTILLIALITLCLVTLDVQSVNGTNKIINTNNIVLAVIFFVVGALCVWQAAVHHKGAAISENKPSQGCKCSQCGEKYAPKLNKFLLLIFPYKVYRDYGVENIQPWVDPQKAAKTAKESKQ